MTNPKDCEHSHLDHTRPGNYCVACGAELDSPAVKLARQLFNDDLSRGEYVGPNGQRAYDGWVQASSDAGDRDTFDALAAVDRDDFADEWERCHGRASRGGRWIGDYVQAGKDVGRVVGFVDDVTASVRWSDGTRSDVGTHLVWTATRAEYNEQRRGHIRAGTYGGG